MDEEKYPLFVTTDDSVPFQCTKDGIIKLYVQDIDHLAKLLGGTPQDKLSVLIHYMDKETNEVRVWDGR